jgi:hypothetical protein
MLANFKRPRVKNNGHLDFIRSLPCAYCGNNVQTEAAHVRTGNPRYGKRNTGGAEKPSDCWAVPLCGEHHRQQHDVNEIEFWAYTGINPFVLALSLYACSGDVMTGESVILAQRSTSRPIERVRT